MRKNSINLALIIIVCGCINFSLSKKLSDGEILYWKKNERLKYTDFQGKPSNDDTLSNISVSHTSHLLGTISKSIDVRLVMEKDRTVFTIYAGMNKKQSWIKNKNDSITLQHEQGHFDICEVYARMLRRDLKQVKGLKEANALYEKISDAQEAEQDRFDKENSFAKGGITPEWVNIINKRLTELEDFQYPVVILKVTK